MVGSAPILYQAIAYDLEYINFITFAGEDGIVPTGGYLGSRMKQQLGRQHDARSSTKTPPYERNPSWWSSLSVSLYLCSLSYYCCAGLTAYSRWYEARMIDRDDSNRRMLQVSTFLAEAAKILNLT